MAMKRKAQEAFGKANGQISAVAAARLAKQCRTFESVDDGPDVKSYDQHHSDDLVAGVPTPSSGLTAESSQPATSTRLSNFRQTAANVRVDDEHCLEIKLRADDCVTLAGEYDLQVLSGLVQTYGAVLRPQSKVHRVYAPSTHALPQIVAHSDTAVVRVLSVKSSIRKLHKLSPLWRNIWTADSKGRSFALLHTTADDPLQRPLGSVEVDTLTETLISSLVAKAEHSGYQVKPMVIGPKSAGKSTFNRMLCNALLTRTPIKMCHLLDLDPGQPEFGPPGQVSLVEVIEPLLGPPFTHLATARSGSHRMLASHTLAAASFRDDPEHYIKCALRLYLDAYGSMRGYDDRAAPLIINTCGWVTGQGAWALARILAFIPTADIVVIGDVEDSLLEIIAAHGGSHHRIPRCPLRPSSRSPAELRAMQTMAYFHQKSSATSAPPSWASKPVSTFRPWSVSYAVSSAGIAAIASYGQQVHSDFLTELIDGSVVAIVIIERDPMLRKASTLRAETFSIRGHEAGADRDLDGDCNTLHDIVERSSEGLPFILANPEGIVSPVNPAFSEYIGLAFVRSIDTKHKKLRLITPLSESQIAALSDKSIMLVRGGFDSPDWAYLEDLYWLGEAEVAGEERLWVSRREMVGVEGAVWRLRHPPLASHINVNR